MLAFSYIIVAGYLILGRPFAYLGMPPLYPAEVYILVACIAEARRLLSLLLGMLRDADIIFLSFVAFLLWGMVETLRAIAAGGDLVLALKGLAPHYYVILFFIGAAAARNSERDFANKMWVLGVACGAYSIVGGLIDVDVMLPWVKDREVGLIGASAGVNFCLIAVVALGSLMGRGMVLPLVLLGVAIMGPQPRASMLGAIVGITTAMIEQRNLRMFVYLSVGAVVLVSFSVIAGEAISFSGAGGRSGTMTVSWMLARLVSSVDPDLAFRMLMRMGAYSEAFNVYSLHGTGTWRLLFWRDVINSLNTQWLWLFGHGYGISLGDIANVGNDVRTPHNFVLYFLGYTGVIGLITFVVLLGALFARFMALPRSPIRAFLVAQLLGLMVQAFFSNNFETPYIAVPFYLTMGLAYGVAREQAVAREQDKVRVALSAGSTLNAFDAPHTQDC